MFITKYSDIYGYISKIKIENFSNTYWNSIKGLKILDCTNNEDIFIIEVDDTIHQEDIIIMNFCEGKSSKDYLNFPHEIFNYYFNIQIKNCDLNIEYDQNVYSINNCEEDLELEIQQEIQNAYDSNRFYFYPIRIKSNIDTYINIGTCDILYRRGIDSPYQSYSFNIDDTIHPREEKYFILNKIKDIIDEDLLHSNTEFLEELEELYSLDEVTLEINGKKRFFSF